MTLKSLKLEKDCILYPDYEYKDNLMQKELKLY